MTRFGSATCAIAILIGVASNAAATGPESSENVATARELYKAGADALDAGDNKTALEKLTAAWALAQTPVIGTTLARAHLAVGHLVDARESALAVARLPPAPNETVRSTQARKEADELATQIAPRIPHVNLSIVGLGSHDAIVKLDGVTVPIAALAVSRQANPGPHMATVDTDDGRHGEGSTNVAEGETKGIDIVLPALASNALPPAPDKLPATTAPATMSTPAATPIVTTSSPSPLVWIGIGTSAAGLALGAITGAFALSEAATVKANCKGVGADGANYCGPAYTGDLSGAKTMATVSTIGFITAGVGVAVLVTGLLLSGKKHDATAFVSPMIGPISGVHGAF